MSENGDSPAVSDSSEDTGQCYCKGSRQLGTIELQCMSCLKWHHQSCVSLTEAETGSIIPFMNAYAFHCKVCSPTGCEGFLKKTASFVQMLQSTIANLIHQNKEEGLFSFSKDKDIIPFIENKWEALTLAPRKTKSTWHATVTKTLGQNPSVFYSIVAPDGSGNLYGMHDTDVRNICPNYESAKQQQNNAANNASGNKSKNLKRKHGASNATGSGNCVEPKRSRNDVAPKLPPHGYPSDHPFNKDEWCYIFAESDPYADKDDDDENETSKLLPPYQYRKVMSKDVLLSMNDRAPQLKLSEDRLSITGDKGYSLAKASHSVYMGSHYFEVTITSLPENSACRIGWAQDFANNQAPLGYDSFGYAYRSRKGTKFHKSIGKTYGKGFAEGDTVGFLINLPHSQLEFPECFKDKPLIKFKNFLYYELKRNAKLQESELTELEGSKIYFFKNGECQGIAYENIYRGHYLPAVSLFKNSSVTFNFGPSFKYPPGEEFSYSPMSERADTEMCEQQMSDMLYLIENDSFSLQYSA